MPKIKAKQAKQPKSKEQQTKKCVFKSKTKYYGFMDIRKAVGNAEDVEKWCKAMLAKLRNVLEPEAITHTTKRLKDGRFRCTIVTPPVKEQQLNS